MDNFRTLADTARKPNASEADVMALLRCYASMGCALYPRDIELVASRWPAMDPPGVTLTPYTAGLGGYSASFAA